MVAVEKVRVVAEARVVAVMVVATVTARAVAAAEQASVAGMVMVVAVRVALAEMAAVADADSLVLLHSSCNRHGHTSLACTKLRRPEEVAARRTAAPTDRLLAQHRVAVAEGIAHCWQPPWHPLVVVAVTAAASLTDPSSQPERRLLPGPRLRRRRTPPA